MSKKRRIRGHRSQWDRIELRRSKCEMMVRITGYCKHGPRFEYGTFDAEASFILAKDAPSMEELKSISCARIWDVIRHPMTQLYAMVDPVWYEEHVLSPSKIAQKARVGQSTPITRRSTFNAKKMLAMAALSSRSRRAYRIAIFALYGNASFVAKKGHKLSNRGRLLLAKRFRAITRKNKVASLNDKYGRPRVSRTAVPSR